jgi:hypothetical protein
LEHNTLFKWTVSEKLCGCEVAQEKNQWWTFVVTVMKLQVAQQVGI